MKKQPTEKQLKARAKFAEQAKNRAKSFVMTAKLNDKEMECKTNNLDEAIESLGLNFPHIKTRMKLNIKQGTKQVDKFLSVPMIKRIFRNALARRIFIRKLIFK